MIKNTHAYLLVFLALVGCNDNAPHTPIDTPNTHQPISSASIKADESQNHSKAVDIKTTPSNAISHKSTLQKIADSKIIVLGYHDDFIPLSYTNDSAKPIGYAQEVQLAIVDAIQQKLGQDINIDYQPTHNADSTIDLDCSAIANDTAKHPAMDFSMPIFATSTRILSAKDSGIQDFSDLAGKTVVSVANTTSVEFLQQYKQSNTPKIHIITAKTPQKAFSMLKKKQAIAFVLDDITLAYAKARAQTPSKWQIVGTPQSPKMYACAFLQGDDDFKELVNDTLKTLYTSGQIHDMYQKWFANPIAPDGVNIHFAMPNSLQALIQNTQQNAPNDTFKQMGDTVSDTAKIAVAVAKDATKDATAEAANAVSDAAKTAEAMILNAPAK